MTIYIAHLYYDLLNLYGEIGNIKSLENSLKSIGIKVVIDNLTIGDDIDFNKYDLIYIASGTEQNKDIVLDDILKYKDSLKEYIENNKFVLSTGNSYELFGKSINDKEALHIFNYNSRSVVKRIVGDVICKTDLINSFVLGFQNRGSIIEHNDSPMFNVVSGIGSYKGSNEEGLHYKNFFGTYLLGPILVRNPELHRYFVKSLIKYKDKKYKIKKLDLKLDEEAFKRYMNEYHKEYL